MTSRVLVVSFEKRWLAPVYVPGILASLGAEVGILAHVDSFAARLISIGRFYAAPEQHGTIEDLHAALAAILDWKPDLVMPADDLAYGVLQALVHYRGSLPAATDASHALVIQSLGDPDGYQILLSKANTLARARALGIAEPENQVARNLTEALAHAEKFNWSAAVKLDGEAGGSGVRLCKTREHVEAAYNEFTGVLRSRGLLGRVQISVQRHVEGPAAACMFAAWKGHVLAGMAFRKLRIYPEPAGPATAVAPFSHPDINEAARKMCASTGFTGLGSMDFVVDTGRPVLLEFNPRMTQIHHLPRYWGIDPVAALLAAMEGGSYETEKVAMPPERITLFPQEWWRDRNSPDLRSGVVDGPFDEPAVMRAVAPDWR